MIKNIFKQGSITIFTTVTFFSILFLSIYVVQAITPGGTGHNNIEINSNGKSIVGYNVTVCSSGCDYNLIQAAFNANSSTPSSYYIAKGTYNETEAVVFPSTSSIHFDRVKIDFLSVETAVYSNSSNNTYVTGNLTIQGTNYNLLTYGGNYNNYKGLEVIINYTGSTADNYFLALLYGSHNDYGTIKIEDVTGATTAGGSHGTMITANGCTHSRGNFFVKDITIDVDNAVGVAVGLRLAINATYNTFHAITNNINNTGSGSPYGIKIDSGSNYNTIIGTMIDNSTPNNAGTGNKLEQLAY